MNKVDLYAFENIPAQLRDHPRFVLWRKEPRYAGDAPTKIPYDPKRHCRASSINPQSWGTFCETIAALEKFSNHYHGIGFMLGDDAPFFGVDLDDCREPTTGVIAPRARGIIRLLDTYTEISPSLTGVKLFGIGEMPSEDGAGKNYRKDPWGKGEGGIEMYKRARLFTLTGQHLGETPSTIENRNVELAGLYRSIYPPTKPRLRRVGTGEMASSRDVRRASNYISKLPPSIDKHGGHSALLYAACTALRFGLSDADAIDVLHEVNQRCQPVWNDRDIERKVSEAHKKVGAEFGCMLNENRSNHRADERVGSAMQRIHWRVSAMIGGAV